MNPGNGVLDWNSGTGVITGVSGIPIRYRESYPVSTFTFPGTTFRFRSPNRVYRFSSGSNTTGYATGRPVVPGEVVRNRSGRNYKAAVAIVKVARG